MRGVSIVLGSVVLCAAQIASAAAPVAVPAHKVASAVAIKDVSGEVKTLIPDGTKKENVLLTFERKGYKVKTVNQKFPKCKECDPVMVWGGYFKEQPAGNGISYVTIQVGFTKGVVSNVSAWYVDGSH